MEKIKVVIEIEDGFLEENRGLWRWKLDKKASWLERIGFLDGKGQTETFSIGELMEWLSGYKPLIKADWMEQVQPLQGIFLDEVV